ncbi:CpaF/VirB11 family protein [Clostridium botulinum]|uniref:CpaF/VirB11 family protein n=1 Tax=Clostridium botulinum TaxID=1491 RepID=UPI001C9B1D1D|nr:CpaF/VirB11 family protein [Clostridium botulinum]
MFIKQEKPSLKKDTIPKKPNNLRKGDLSSKTHNTTKPKPKKIFDKGLDEKMPDILKQIMSDEEHEHYEKPIDDFKLQSIQDDLTRSYPEEVLQALTNEDIRKKLVKIVTKQHGNYVKNDKKIAEYVVRECIGTGVIEKILKNNKITDIGWNGTHLSIETNDNKVLIEGSKLEITDSYIQRVISKYATVNDKPFNPTHSILDGMFKNIRISATHIENSPNGTTMSMRVARPRLALNKNNFKNFAPDYILELFEKIVLTKANIVISGETGTGKTELQKLLMSFINNNDKIIMIEDVQETHAKELFPEKDIYAWLTTPKVTISDLVKASLRNNPIWIMVSETRGSEAYQMLQAVLSGHKIITTLHTINARAIPRRFINMCASGYKINESSVEEDIYRYFDFSVHIKKVRINGETIRYLNEIVEFNEDEAITVFKQNYVNGKFVCENGVLSDEFKERMDEKGISFQFPVEEIEEDTTESLDEVREVVKN